MPTRVIFDPTYATSIDDVRRELALHRRVPLLDVTRAQVAIDGEDALSKSGIRRQRNRLDARARCQSTNAGVDVVERALRDRLEERKHRRRERRRDARLSIQTSA